jgi:hypothetical protein
MRLYSSFDGQVASAKVAFTLAPSLIWQLATAFFALQQYMNSSASSKAWH